MKTGGNERVCVCFYPCLLTHMHFHKLRPPPNDTQQCVAKQESVFMNAETETSFPYQPKQSVCEKCFLKTCLHCTYIYSSRLTEFSGELISMCHQSLVRGTQVWRVFCAFLRQSPVDGNHSLNFFCGRAFIAHGLICRPYWPWDQRNVLNRAEFRKTHT